MRFLLLILMIEYFNIYVEWFFFCLIIYKLLVKWIKDYVYFDYFFGNLYENLIFFYRNKIELYFFFNLVIIIKSKVMNLLFKFMI